MVEIIGGASITSKRPSRMLTGLRSIQAKGCQVLLEDGRWYTDWQMGLHGIIYGYAPDWWIKALSDAITDGPASSIAHRDERIVAEMLAGFYPDIEAVRFMCNGSDPCAAAVKLARAITGREKILVQGYHGTASAFASPPQGFEPDNRRGTLEAEREAYVPLAFAGDVGKLSLTHFVSEPGDLKGYAAVFIEVPPDDGGYESAKAFLHSVADKAHQGGALFVLDEVITGFRLAPGGAAEFYDLQGKVDLYCFGKTLGNGYPVAALAGRKEIMKELSQGPDGSLVHFSGTWFGEPLGLAAAKATLKRLREEPPWLSIENRGEELKQRWNELEIPWKLTGHPARPVLRGKTGGDKLLSLRRHLFSKGHIVTAHPWYVTCAHGEKHIRDLLSSVHFWKHSGGAV